MNRHLSQEYPVSVAEAKARRADAAAAAARDAEDKADRPARKRKSA